MSDQPSFTTSAYSRAGTGTLSLDVFPPVSDSRRSAVLLFHGGGWRSGAKEAVHVRAAALAADLVAASPIAIADAGFPPTILLHGTADSAIATAASIALHQRLGKLGVPSDLHIYAGRDHEFDLAPSMLEATVAATASFLDRMVVRRPEFDDEAEQFSFLRLISAPPSLPPLTATHARPQPAGKHCSRPER